MILSFRGAARPVWLAPRHFRVIVRVRALFVMSAVSGLVAAGVAVPADAATTPAVATVLVGDNVGDGGPAATAQASSTLVARETNGSIVFFDELTQQLRIYNPTTGLVNVLYGHKHSPEIKYSVPTPSEGADALTSDLRDPAQLWVDNAANVYLTFDYHSHLWRIDHATHKFHLMFQGYDIPDEYHLVQYVQVVRHDGSLLVDFARTEPTTGERPHVTTWVPANASYDTVQQSFAPHTMPQATEDAAGNLYYVQGAGIWRRTPAGIESLVAGVDTDVIPANDAPRAEGASSLGATMNPYDLHATPDGRLVYTEPLDPDATHPAPRTRVRIATVGGTVHNVVNPAGTGSDTDGPLPQYGLAWFATDNNQLIDGGAGAVRSWQLDGSQAAGRGTDLVGLNDLGGPVSSPDGTPTSLAAIVTAGAIGVDPRDGSVVLPQPEDIRVVRHSASGDHLYRWGGGGHPADGVGDGLLATQAEMRSGTVRFAAGGTAYVLTADGPQAHPEWRVRKVDTNGVVSTVVGGGASPLAEGASLTDVALPSDSMPGAPFALSPDGHSLLVAFGETAKIWQFDLVNGVAHRLSGTGGSTPAVGTSLATASIFQAYWVGYDPAGHVLVDDGTTLWQVDGAGLLQAGPAPGGAYERVFLADGSIVSNFASRLTLTRPAANVDDPRPEPVGRQHHRPPHPQRHHRRCRQRGCLHQRQLGGDGRRPVGEAPGHRHHAARRLAVHADVDAVDVRGLHVARNGRRGYRFLRRPLALRVVGQGVRLLAEPGQLDSDHCHDAKRHRERGKRGVLPGPRPGQLRQHVGLVRRPVHDAGDRRPVPGGLRFRNQPRHRDQR